MGNNKFIHSPDMSGLKEVLSGEYDIALRENPKTVLDIGANQGAFSFWARKNWPNCRIDAYEPIPENIEYYRKNLPDDANTRLWPFAVSISNTLEMRMGQNNLGECSAAEIGCQEGHIVNVNAFHPSKLPAAEFIKIDTEGLEVDILRNLDLSQAKAVALEYHRNTDVPLIKEVCERAGLVLYDDKPHELQRGIIKFRHPSAVPTMKNLFVAMPVYRQMDTLTVQSLISLTSTQLCRGTFSMAVDMHCGECPIGRARNDLTHSFLSKKEFTHILFIDSDIIFSYEQVERILSHNEDIVGGFYMKKQEGNASPVCNTFETVGLPDHRGLIKMKYMGTGFLCVSRRVFEVMIQEIGKEIEYTDDSDQSTKHDFWRMGVHKDKKSGRARWLSEDWQFCQFALDLGFEIWADAKILVRHSGQAVFPLSYQLRELYTLEQLQRMGLSGKSDSTDVTRPAGAVTDSPPAAAPA